MSSNGSGTKRPRAPRAARKSADQQLLADQQQANQNLVLAILRAHEQIETVAAAQVRCEQLAAELKQREQELRAVAERREQALGMVGHDLRNPLGAISMCVQFMMVQGNLNEEGSRLAELALKSVRRMDRMINLLFEFTRARLGGGLPIDLAPADLRQICRDAIDELKLSTDIPIREEYVGDLRGTWDATRLVETLSNLVGNAIDHAAPGTDVLLKARGEGSELIVDVVNRGEPIPTPLLPVLFSAFHQGWPGFRAKTGHLGLGLYIAHEIVQAHGGTLSAHCAAGVTTFTVRLPRQFPPI